MIEGLSGLKFRAFLATERIKHLACAQILNVLQQTLQARVFLFQIKMVAATETCESLWVSPIALEYHFNNTCVTPKRCDILKVRQAVEGKKRSEAECFSCAAEKIMHFDDKSGQAKTTFC